jgi:hypothetical protein
MARAFPVSPAVASKFLGELASKRKRGTGLIVDEKRLINNLKKHGVRVSEEILAEMRRFMAAVERAAKKRAPVEFGFMRAGVWWRIGRQGNQIVGELGSSSGYGKYTEFVDKSSSSPRSVFRASRSNPGGYQGAGTVAKPFTWWPAKSGNNKKGRASASRETMPWARPAIVETFKKTMHQRLQRAIRRAQRG